MPDLQEDLGDSAVQGCEGCPLGVAQLGADAHGDYHQIWNGLAQYTWYHEDKFSWNIYSRSN